jgi:hypothetical protein
VTFVQVILLTTQLCLYRGPTLCLMVGPWNGTHPRPTQTPPSDVLFGLAWCLHGRCVQFPCFKLRCMTWNLWLFCNNFPSWEIYVTFKHSCNISACDVKCDGICISGLAFMQGTLFDPAFGGLSGRYPTDQRIIPFEARWSPQKWTRVLEPV